MKNLNKLIFELNLKLITLVALVFCFGSIICAQKVDLKPFAVSRTTAIDELKKIKNANPKISAEEFTAAANALLEKKGLNFVFAFDAATCRKIEEAKKARKDPNAPLNLRTALKSVSGESASLALPEPGFEKSECAPCFVALPVLELTGKDFVTVVEGINIKFSLPANFTASEAALVDGKDLRTVITKWKLPFRTTPLSVSDKGDILYVGFPENELSDLVLMIDNEGAFQFTARKNIDAAKKAVPVVDFPAEAGNPQLAFIRFEKNAAIQTVRFSRRCEN